MVGRIVTEAMPGGVTPPRAVKTLRSEPSDRGLRTVLDYQVVGTTRYFDAAGFPGRTVGLSDTGDRRVGPLVSRPLVSRAK